MYREVAPIWWMNMCWFCFTFYYKQTFTGWFSCCLLVMQRNTYIAAWLCKTVFQVKMQDGENMYYIDKSIIRYCKLWTSSAGTYSLHLVFFIMISHVEVMLLSPNHLDFFLAVVILPSLFQVQCTHHGPHAHGIGGQGEHAHKNWWGYQWRTQPISAWLLTSC